MAAHNDFGKKGEEIAAAWLIENGYTILHRNWRHSYHEIDIIALKQDRLHIIEVKARNGNGFGYPETSVNRKKFKDLQRATDEFLFRNPGYKWLQYDILSIINNKGSGVAFFLIEDVYFW